MPKAKPRRLNIYFRQTASAFRAARQTQIFSHIKRNIVYTINSYSRFVFKRRLNTENIKDKNMKLNLPESAKKIR